MSEVAEWTYRPEYHLGDPAFSLFDPAGDRSAVGLTQSDAKAICLAMNSRADLLVAAKTVLAGLNARIDGADPSAVPVFSGIADLTAAISRAEGR